jgi:4-oxalocrotonate tautomerase
MSHATEHNGTAIGYGVDAVSVGFDEVSPADWSSRVYAPAIAGWWDTLLKTPGYGLGPASQDRR